MSTTGLTTERNRQASSNPMHSSDLSSSKHFTTLSATATSSACSHSRSSSRLTFDSESTSCQVPPFPKATMNRDKTERNERSECGTLDLNPATCPNPRRPAPAQCPTSTASANLITAPCHFSTVKKIVEWFLYEEPTTAALKQYRKEQFAAHDLKGTDSREKVSRALNINPNRLPADKRNGREENSGLGGVKKLLSSIQDKAKGGLTHLRKESHGKTGIDVEAGSRKEIGSPYGTLDSETNDEDLGDAGFTEGIQLRQMKGKATETAEDVASGAAETPVDSEGNKEGITITVQVGPRYLRQSSSINCKMQTADVPGNDLSRTNSLAISVSMPGALDSLSSGWVAPSGW